MSCPACRVTYPAFDAGGPHFDPDVTVPATPPTAVDDLATAPALEALPDDGPTLPQARPGAVMPARFNISLAITGGVRSGEVVRLERSSCVIGRVGPDGSADLRIDDPTLSRAHAAIECLGGIVVLRDLGSHNGTFVDEQRVETATLEDRAEFRLGRTRFMLILTAKE
jgi:pSer/pThr/pTyr-binding forkhead associated (FHA) protein